MHTREAPDFFWAGGGGGRVQGGWGVTQRHELRVSFKVNMKTKCLDSIIVLFLI